MNRLLDVIYVKSNEDRIAQNVQNKTLNEKEKNSLKNHIRVMLATISTVLLMGGAHAYKEHKAEEERLNAQRLAYETQKEERDHQEQAILNAYYEEASKIVENPENQYDYGTRIVSGKEERTFGYNHEKIADAIVKRSNQLRERSLSDDFNVFMVFIYEELWYKDANIDRIIQALPNEYNVGATTFKKWLEKKGYKINEDMTNPLSDAIEEAHFKAVYAYGAPQQVEEVKYGR